MNHHQPNTFTCNTAPDKKKEKKMQMLVVQAHPIKSNSLHIGEQPTLIPYAIQRCISKGEREKAVPISIPHQASFPIDLSPSFAFQFLFYLPPPQSVYPLIASLGCDAQH